MIRPGLVRRGSHGYAMAMFILVLVVVSVAVVSVSTATSSYMAGSRDAKFRAEARALANSSAESFYARMVENADWSAAFTQGLADPARRPAFHPAWVPGSGVSYVGGTLTASGWVACTGSTNAPAEDCARVSVDVLGGSAADPTLIQLTVRVKAGCKGTAERCVDATFQQRLRKPRFYDYLSLTQWGTLDPFSTDTPSLSDGSSASKCAEKTLASLTGPAALCKEIVPAYRSTDVTNGPLYIGESSMLVCPSVTSPHLPSLTVEMIGSSPSWLSANDWRGDVGCANRVDALVNGDAVRIVNVSGLTFPNANDLSAGVEKEAREATCGSGACLTTINTSAGVVATFTGTGTTVSGQGLVPYGNLIRITGGGSVKVSGTAYGPVTIIADGEIVIDGDITVSDPAIAGVGLVSVNKPITIEQNDGADRNIQAVLVSFTSSVTVRGWATGSSTITTEPVLHITGTVAGKYQSVFGGYDANTGRLVSGYRKDITWDDRFLDPVKSDLLFRWMPRPLTNDWRRLDLSEVKNK